MTFLVLLNAIDRVIFPTLREDGKLVFSVTPTTAWDHLRQQRWVLGRYEEPLENFPRRMAEIVGGEGCGSGCSGDSKPAGPDCLVERQGEGYDSGAREEWESWMMSRVGGAER